jgi:hypothetical protein
MIRAAALLAALLADPGGLMSETRKPSGPALELEVVDHGNAIEVRLHGHAAEARQVSYELEVTGTSTSRHRGSTSLAAGSPVVLSAMRVSVGESWCARLRAEEAGRAPYEILRGPACAASAE